MTETPTLNLSFLLHFMTIGRPEATLKYKLLLLARLARSKKLMIFRRVCFSMSVFGSLTDHKQTSQAKSNVRSSPPQVRTFVKAAVTSALCHNQKWPTYLFILFM